MKYISSPRFRNNAAENTTDKRLEASKNTSQIIYIAYSFIIDLRFRETKWESRPALTSSHDFLMATARDPTLELAGLKQDINLVAESFASIYHV
jgi:hypothetical protein